MANQVFTDATATVPGTLITSAWLTDANTGTYDRLTAVTGTNAITAVGPAGMASYLAGQNFYFTPGVTNSGPVTININGLGVQNIVKNNGVALVGLDLIAGQIHEISYDGTSFFLMNPGVTPVAAGGTGATTASQALLNLGAVGRLLNVQTFTSNGTYTPTAGTTRIRVELVGGGGGGGGSAATGANQSAVGGGGGAGGYCQSFITSGFSGAAVVIAIAGSAGTIGTVGGTGGNTTFGALCSAGGGVGGGAGVAGGNPTASGGLGGIGTSGTILNVRGQSGQPAFAVNAQPYTQAGAGANSTYGAGGVFSFVVSGSGNNSGNSATGFGSGGGGAATGSSNGGAAGGGGVPGILIIQEYS